MYRQYPSEHRPYPHRPGSRFWASGFRLSDPPSKIVRNMPPTMVETTCGARDASQEAELRKTVKYAGYVAPIGPDGEPLLKKTSTYGDLRFFADRADAEAAYADETADAVAAVDGSIKALQDLRDKVLDLSPSKKPGQEGTTCC